MERSTLIETSPGLPLAQVAQNNEILALISQIREVFELYFDRSWLAVVIDELPMDKRTVREVRDFVALRYLWAEDEPRIETGIEELRRYIWTLKNHLLPNVKELLGVSPFSPLRRRMDKSQYILRRLTAHALPYNLKNLTSLVDALETRFRSRHHYTHSY